MSVTYGGGDELCGSQCKDKVRFFPAHRAGDYLFLSHSIRQKVLESSFGKGHTEGGMSHGTENRSSKESVPRNSEIPKLLNCVDFEKPCTPMFSNEK